MANRKLQKKARAIKTVETYATAPTCSTCESICKLTNADVRAQTQTSMFNQTGGVR